MTAVEVVAVEAVVVSAVVVATEDAVVRNFVVDTAVACFVAGLAAVHSAADFEVGSVVFAAVGFVAACSGGVAVGINVAASIAAGYVFDLAVGPVAVVVEIGRAHV